MMRAITYQRYGGPEVLRYQEIQAPTLAPDQVLVEVCAASLNAADYRLMRADPFLARLANGLFRPKRWPIMGSDFAGIVVQVGAQVTTFKPGDEVFGDASQCGRGAFAEYISARTSAVALKPPSASFSEAAALPLAGLTALQAARDSAKLKPGDEVLIYGAGGGVGLALTQLALAYGATVTASCSPKSAPLVQAAGAHHVLDYALPDAQLFPSARYDIIFGVNGYRAITTYKHGLKAHGRYVMIGGTNRQLYEGLLLSKLGFLGSGKQASVLNLNTEHLDQDLAQLAQHFERGQLRPHIASSYPLAEAAQAMRALERGEASGKVILLPKAA